MDQPTYVTVVAGGTTYSAFTQVAVQYAANQAARTFALTVTDATDGWDDQWNFMPGTQVTILGNGQRSTDFRVFRGGRHGPKAGAAARSMQAGR